MAVETTGDIVRRLLSQDDQRKLAQAGLIVVKREDLEAHKRMYNDLKEQNQALRKMMEVKHGQAGTDSPT